MKINLFFIIITFIFLSSCSDKKSNNVETLPPLEVEIPAELSNNQEVVGYIRASEKSINDFANKIEKFYLQNPDLLSKEAEDMSMFEKLKVMQVAGEMAIAFGEFSMHYADMNTRMENFEQVMDEQQVAAMATVGEAFKKRMKLLEQRLEKIKSVQ